MKLTESIEEERQRKIGALVKTAIASLPPDYDEMGTHPDPRSDERRWFVYSTALTPCWLMLECDETGAQGVVKDPTKEEWSAAFHAPSDPYRWPDNGRVTLMMEGKQ